MTRGGGWLVAGGLLSLAASLAHLGCIVFGTPWYRFFGVPEPMIRSHEAGHPQLAWMTAGIALLLAVWAAYAFSGAGLTRRLPLVRTALIAIAAIYLLRGALLVPALARAPYPNSTFDVVSSAIVLVYGLVHAVGIWLAWRALSERRARAA